MRIIYGDFTCIPAMLFEFLLLYVMQIIYLQATALHICLLFLDVALASHDPWKFVVSSTFSFFH